MAAAIAACSGSEKTTGKAIPSNPYSAGDLDVDAIFRVFHVDRDSSRIFVRLNTRNLLYSRVGTEQFSARVQIKINPVVLTPGFALQPKAKTIQLTDTDDEKTPKDLLVSTGIILPTGADYDLRIEIIDVFRKRSTTKSVVAFKSSPYHRQNFIAARNDLRVPLFYDRVSGGERILLGTNAAPEGKLYVRYYDRAFVLPPPPFVLYEPKAFDYTPDGRFTLELDENNHTSFVTASRGFYHFVTDTTQNDGFTLFVSETEFPAVTTVQNMLEPFRFLVSSKEFKSVSEAPDVKQALEQMWLEWSGDRERARKSIKLFYSRVEDANIYFSSHVDGWRTDRGIVYLIYGKPNKVYRSLAAEVWIYGEENNPLSITFTFVKVINPFTPNDYRLNREEYYRPSWYRALDAWRSGRII
jgi:GWxTD domain-containing protein